MEISADDLKVIEKAVLIGWESWNGDGWYASEAGYDYEEAEEILKKAMTIIRDMD